MATDLQGMCPVPAGFLLKIYPRRILGRTRCVVGKYNYYFGWGGIRPAGVLSL